MPRKNDSLAISIGIQPVKLDEFRIEPSKTIEKVVSW
jgi:hypothetical protein